ncbi:MAG: hypothetical protein K0U13_02770, partial [Chlamydiae bacterium]|nr:hypothetical protein [Chlamydiota bacterium]
QIRDRGIRYNSITSFFLQETLEALSGVLAGMAAISTTTIQPSLEMFLQPPSTTKNSLQHASVSQLL